MNRRPAYKQTSSWSCSQMPGIQALYRWSQDLITSRTALSHSVTWQHSHAGQHSTEGLDKVLAQAMVGGAKRGGGRAGREKIEEEV